MIVVFDTQREDVKDRVPVDFLLHDLRVPQQSVAHLRVETSEDAG
jgi:hypothetical protein